MRFKNDKLAPWWSAIGLCGLLLSGCGPKDQPAANKDLAMNATPEAAKVAEEPKPAQTDGTNDNKAPKEPAGAPKKLIPIPKNATRLIVEDIKIGSGMRAEPGTSVSVIYTGALTNGTVFDSNANSGQPFTLMLGAGQVIKGWDNGLVGMKVGGKRRLIIPPDMGYGDQAAPGGKIPPGSTLVFTVEMKDVK